MQRNESSTLEAFRYCHLSKNMTSAGEYIPLVPQPTGKLSGLVGCITNNCTSEGGHKVAVMGPKGQTDWRIGPLLFIWVPL